MPPALQPLTHLEGLAGLHLHTHGARHSELQDVRTTALVSSALVPLCFLGAYASCIGTRCVETVAGFFRAGGTPGCELATGEQGLCVLVRREQVSDLEWRGQNVFQCGGSQENRRAGEWIWTLL